MTMRPQTRLTPRSPRDAETLQRAVHALGGTHVGLSFHNHPGRWDPMPFGDEVIPLAHDLVTALGPYLERPHFSAGISGADH